MTEHEATETMLAPASSWHTASYSVERGACVEVSEGPFTVIRDTQNRKLGALVFAADEWESFITTAKV